MDGRVGGWKGGRNEGRKGGRECKEGEKEPKKKVKWAKREKGFKEMNALTCSVNT